MIRPELRAAFDRDENRDHVCSCLACVESRRPGPVVVFTEDDIEWNQKIEAELCTVEDAFCVRRDSRDSRGVGDVVSGGDRMTDNYAVSLWDGPDTEKVVSIYADGPRVAARMAEDANPGWQAHFVGRLKHITASGRCVKCGGVSLVGDRIRYEGTTQTCGACLAVEGDVV